MKRRFLAIGALAMAMFGGGVLVSANSSLSSTVHEIKSGALESRREKKHRAIKQIGGLDMVGVGGVFGLSPKEYGLVFGSGECRKHSNRLRFGHNAKLKKRRS